MIKPSRLAVVVLVGVLIAGCGTTAKEIQSKASGEKKDSFQEIEEQRRSPEGLVDVVIKAQVKTPFEGYFLFESPRSPHGKGTYPFLFNIDGQSVLWEVHGEKENTPLYDSNGKVIPDGGNGMRYVLMKVVRLREGRHRVFFALPGDNYFKEVEITLSGDVPSVLEFKPMYGKDARRRETFYRGIKDFTIVLNGRRLT